MLESRRSHAPEPQKFVTLGLARRQGGSYLFNYLVRNKTIEVLVIVKKYVKKIDLPCFDDLFGLTHVWPSLRLVVLRKKKKLIQ